MVRLDKLLDAWRADPRVDATVELGSMLLRANVKAPGALPRAFVVEFGDEAARKHATQLSVLDVLSRLFAVSGEGSRAQALYARAASLFPGEARVSELETALRNAGLAVPPPAVAAKLAPPPPQAEPPPKKELPPPRAHAGSLADFAPGAVDARRIPIDSTLLEPEPSTSTGSSAVPDHVPEVPTRELESSAIEAAIGDESIPRRPRAPTVAGLGIPMAPPGTPPPGAGGGSQPPAPVVAPPAGNRPVPQRRNKTLVPDPGFAPPAFGAVPPVGQLKPPAVPPEAVIRAPAIEPASPARMFTPARAFTPPPGGLNWNGLAISPAPGGRPPVDDDASDAETATGVLTPERRRAAIIDNPTTTQESLTRPIQLAPRAPEVSPPTQTRLVPEEAQLRAAAASLIGPGRASDVGAMPPSPGASRPAARRAVPARERRRIPDPDDDPPTGVTSTDTNVTAPPTGAFDAATLQRQGEGDGGQRTARRDTSELLAAALRPAAPGAPPALGSPAAASAEPHPPVAPPPRMAQPSSPDGVSTVARAAPGMGLPLRPPPGAGASGPPVKPTLVSRGAPSAPQAKPTLVSPGGRTPARPAGASGGPREQGSSVGAPPPAPIDPGGTELTGRIAKPGLAILDEPSHADEVDTRVRPLAPPAPSPMASPSPTPAPVQAARPAALAVPSWDPKHPPVPPSTVDPRREPDDDGPSTNVIAPSRGAAPAPRRAARPEGVVDEPSFEELSGDAIEILDGQGVRAPAEGGDSPTGKIDGRAARSTQKLAGTVAPAVMWSPDAGDAGGGGVRTKVLTVEESRAAGRVDPLPAPDEAWMITPPPPVAPRFGPPPSLPPSSAGFAPASVGPPSTGPSSLGPSSMPMSGYGPISSAPTFGPPAPIPPRPPAASLVGPQRRSASPIVVGSIVGVALSLLVAGGAWLYDELSTTSTTGPKAAAQTADVEALVLAGRRADLDRADVLLREPAPRSAEKDRAMTRLRERSIRALELGSTAGLEDAASAARGAGWTEAEVAFASLARAVAERDLKTASALQQKWSGPRGTDAYFMLAAAAASEQRGDRKALELYGAALGLEPRLRPAALRVARAELLEGNEDRGVARIEGLAAQGPPTPEVVALRGLAWLRLRRAPGSTAPRPTEAPPAPEELPVELRFVPDALRLAEGDLPPAARKAAVEVAVARADTPAVAVLVGELAFELRVESAALEIGRKQLALHPTHTPSLALFAKSALALAKLDVMETVAAGLPVPQQNHIKAVIAYERGDVAVVVQTRAWLGDRDEPGREAIVARAERIAGRKKMPTERIQALGRAEVVGGELVAVDALLDAGDLAGARAIVDGWGDPTAHPLRALRAARLLRYQGKLTEAEAALDAALPTRPALVERILLEAETPEGRTHARSMLDRGFGDDRALYEAYLLALDGKVPAARKLLDATELPPEDAPLARRVAAALALAVVGDEERGRDRIRRLAADWPQNPDVQRALESLPGAASPAPRSRPPPRRGRGPRR